MFNKHTHTPTHSSRINQHVVLVLMCISGLTGNVLGMVKLEIIHSNLPTNIYFADREERDFSMMEILYFDPKMIKMD